MNKIELKTDYLYYKCKKDIVIYHMADIHFNVNTKVSKFEKILKKVSEDKPNYIIITGDLLDTPEIIKDTKKIKELVKFLSDLSIESKVLISIGNHDIYFEKGINFFKKLNEFNNIYVLDNYIYQDEFIYVYGAMLPGEYYYNVLGCESKEYLIDMLKDNNYIKDMPKSLFKIGLFHSPVCLTDKEVFKYLDNFNLLLSGHMHNGMVPNIVSKYGKGNMGIIGPFRKWFPKVCRGRIDTGKTSLIITGGVTKLSYKSARSLSYLNFLYNIGINKIILTSDRLKTLKSNKK